jgi:glycosyltransferase involved in cell wall biosynthesis
MRILFLKSFFYPSKQYGGSVESSWNFCRRFVATGHEVRVLTTDADGIGRLPLPYRGFSITEGVPIFYGARLLRSKASVGFMRELPRLTRWAEVVHIDMVYEWFFPLATSMAKTRGLPVVVSPRGTLMGEARRQKAVKKKLYEVAILRRALQKVDMFHVTSRVEAADLGTWFHGAPIAMIPNGVEVPAVLPERGQTRPPYLLYLGRLDRYKRVERIMMAFGGTPAVGGQGTRAGGGPWTLVIAGDGEPSYRRELERVAVAAGVGERMRFVGHIAAGEKARLLAQAEFVVQAPNPENFGNVVAEALAHGTPALVGKGLPWERLDREGCGFWVDDSEEALADGMRRLMALSPEERCAMGARGRAWMARDFSWDSVARRMLAVYEELVQERRPRSANGG